MANGLPATAEAPPTHTLPAKRKMGRKSDPELASDHPALDAGTKNIRRKAGVFKKKVLTGVHTSG